MRAARCRRLGAGESAVADCFPRLTRRAVRRTRSSSTTSRRASAFTYALNESRRTIVRGSYAMFASQLDSSWRRSPCRRFPYYSYVYYSGVDTNGNAIADA